MELDLFSYISDAPFAWDRQNNNRLISYVGIQKWMARTNLIWSSRREQQLLLVLKVECSANIELQRAQFTGERTAKETEALSALATATTSDAASGVEEFGRPHACKRKPWTSPVRPGPGGPVSAAGHRNIPAC
jgi:hypothetical protein